MELLKTTILVCAMIAVAVAGSIFLPSFKGIAPPVSAPAAQVASPAAVAEKFDPSNFSDGQIKKMRFEVDEKSTEIDPWLNGFLYRQPISVTSGAALTDYQVKVVVNTQTLVSAGKLRTDCYDLVFTGTDGYTPINYYFESACNAASTIIWVKVPSLAVGTQTIYMYYGNSGRASPANSSGDNVFLFFDDFPGPLDTTKWTAVGGPSISFASGKMTINTNAVSEYIKTKTFVAGPGVAMRITEKDNTANTYPGEFGFGIRTSTSANHVMKETYTSDTYWIATGNGSGGEGGGTTRSDDNTMHTWDLYWLSGSADLLKDGTSVSSSSSHIPSASLVVTLGFPNALSGTSDSQSVIDWVMIRQYVASDPTGAPGSETAMVTQVGSAADWTWRAPVAGDKVPVGSAASWTWTTWADDGTGIVVPLGSATDWIWAP